MDDHYHCGEMAGGGADERKNQSRWTKLVSNPFALACLALSLELAPDLWGGGLWVIARALPAPAVIWFVAEGSQLQPSHHFVQDGYCLQGERRREWGRKRERGGTNCEEGQDEREGEGGADKEFREKKKEVTCRHEGEREMTCYYITCNVLPISFIGFIGGTCTPKKLGKQK